MKHSLQNDTGLSATKPVDPYTSKIKSEGATSSPSSKLLEGKLVSFKNADGNEAPSPAQYHFDN